MKYEERKLAVMLPGLGYHCDKPLLYYTKKILKSFGYDIEEINYKNLPKWKKESLPQVGKIVVEQAEKAWEEMPKEKYDKIIFVSKSIGSFAACNLIKKIKKQWGHICFTPIDMTIPLFEKDHTIVFSGTADPLIDTEDLRRASEDKYIPVHFIEGGNHSLETDDVIKNIDILHKVMIMTREFVRTGGSL